MSKSIADGFCLPIFYWFSQDCITIIIIHEHDIHISFAWLVWESAREITESFFIEVETDDCYVNIMCLHCFCVWVEIDVLFNFHLWFYMLCRLDFFLFCSICPKAVTMLGGRYFNNCWFFRPIHVRKSPFLIAFRKCLGMGLKQHPWRYWISSVFSCLLWLLQDRDVSMVLRWVCPIGHLSCFCVPLKKVSCL